MKRFLQSRFVSNYGSVFVLLALCAYYSVVTYGEQHPISRSAGRALARKIVREKGSQVRVAIVVRATKLDAQFADAIQQELKRQGALVVERLAAARPAEARQAVERWEASFRQPLQAIATHQPTSEWGALRDSRLKRAGQQNPALADLKVYRPRSYYWPSFLTWQNLTNVLNQNADIAIIAIGMTLVIITAGIDLSVGSLLAVSSVMTAIVIQSDGASGILSFALAAILSIGLCAAIGAGSGVLVTRMKIPAFIVTLAGMMIFRGIALILAVRYQRQLSGGTTDGTPEAVKISEEAFLQLGGGEIFGVYNPIWIMILLYVLAHVVMSHTAFGRQVYAVGGNPEAARLSGVRVGLVLVCVYAICGALAGLAGVLDASRFGGGRPNGGDLYELQVIAAVVVGGTSLSGGEGKIFGTLIGALIMAVIQNGLFMAGVKSYEQKVIFGLLILFAVLIDQLKKHGWSSN